MMTEKRNFGLDIIRCTAVMLVLLAHTLQIVSSKPLIGKFRIFAAVWGVELFFALSGFLIGTILIKSFTEFETSFETCKKFWIRRWFRTLPNYFLMLIVYLLFPIITGSTDFPITLSEFLKHIFFIQRLKPINFHYYFYSVSWSLCIEECFYLIFPILIILFYNITKNVKQSVFNSIIFISIFCLVERCIGSNYFNWLWDEGFRKTMTLRLDSIGFGVLAAYTKVYYISFWRNKRLLLFIGIISQLFLIYFFNHLFLNKYYIPSDTQIANVGNFMNIWFFTFNSLSLICFIPYISDIDLKNKFITIISIISYSVYLTHPLVLMVNHRVEWAHKYIEFSCLYIVIFVISYLQYNFFEKRFTNMRNRFTNSHNSITKLNYK